MSLSSFSESNINPSDLTIKPKQNSKKQPEILPNIIFNFFGSKIEIPRIANIQAFVKNYRSGYFHHEED